MKTMQDWFDAYAVSHQNKTNKLIHWICVPVIFFSVVGFFTSIPSDFISSNFPPAIAPYAHFGTLLMIVGLLFYYRISVRMALGMTLVAAICVFANTWLLYNVETPLWLISLILFVAAWIGQFYGHHLEGAKPSFLEDLQFLMIGPAWLLGFIYKRLGLKY